MSYIIVLHKKRLVSGLLDGIDRAARTINSLGPPAATRITFTSKPDLARAIAELAILSMLPVHEQEVPAHAHVSGWSPTISELAEVLKKLDGGEYQVVEGDVNAEKERLVNAHAAGKEETLLAYMR